MILGDNSFFKAQARDLRYICAFMKAFQETERRHVHAAAG